MDEFRLLLLVTTCDRATEIKKVTKININDGYKIY